MFNYASVHTINGNENVLDSREIQDRIDYLSQMEHPTVEEARELAELTHFAEDVKNYSDEWEFGITLVRYNYCVEYVQEYAEDIHGSESHKWPFNHIDWEKAAEEFFMHGGSSELFGIAYSYVV